MKPQVAIVRGKFLNKYEMQFFEPLTKEFHMTGFSSLVPFHDHFAFPVVKLFSPMDIPEFPFRMPILNRLCIDAHYLWGLEERLRGFDIVHTAETYFHYTQQCLDAKKKGYVKKVIATVLENIPHNNEGIWGRKQFKKRARKELDHIIALTEKTKEALIQEGADPRKISVIRHFVDTNRFFPRATKRNDPTHIVILFCGRLEVYKGVYDIVLAAKEILADPELSSYRFTFRMVGDGSEHQRLVDLEKRFGIEESFLHKAVPYRGMPKEYGEADIFVAPSKPTPTWEEQYCTVLLEAQAAGLPIVTTKTGGIPENVGEAAILVDPGDIKALTKAIKMLVVNSRMRTMLAKRARKRAIDVHDIHIGASKLAVLYRTLLSS